MIVSNVSNAAPHYIRLLVAPKNDLAIWRRVSIWGAGRLQFLSERRSIDLQSKTAKISLGQTFLVVSGCVKR